MKIVAALANHHGSGYHRGLVPLRALAAHELPIGHGDWVANALHHAADSLSVSSKLFASVYLLGHGVVKLVLVASLWREKLWAFPGALAFIVAFACYQVYRFMHTHSLPLLAFTAIDCCVAVLVWREYRARKAQLTPVPRGR